MHISIQVYIHEVTYRFNNLKVVRRSADVEVTQCSKPVPVTFGALDRKAHPGHIED